MDCITFKEQIEKAPIASRAQLQKIYLFMTAGDMPLPEFEEVIGQADTYQDAIDAVYNDSNRTNSLLWAECAKFKRRNWLKFFEPKMLIANARMKTDGLPIQFGSGVMLAPTGSRDNIANLYVFESKAFNANAADFVTSIGGTFTLFDYEFCGIYGVYKYRGNVILEEWEVEHDPVKVDSATR